MKIDNLTLAFGNKIVLKDIDIEIKSGEFVFFIGHSGSGKTSLIRSLIGDLKPMRGDIVLDNGAFLYKNLSDEILLKYRRQIGVIFQDYKLMDSKKVYENVAFAMEVCGYKDQYVKKRVPEALKQVGLLIKKDKFVCELSGGEKQRVSIARALVHNPSVIIGDEPTGNLDPTTANEILDILIDLNKEGKTIIIATHDKNIVDKLKKRVILFKDKQIMSDEKRGMYIE
ncbi:ATP-binding cassette domain-containing protein [Candidatus Gracilibacteria bacterium]|nr:ATP-binding cassette domain-containing protein [Candidatus Gracilibacteria bacterium]NUJ98350.1 ATP-binding cassette domain-containing protein [Candidatus Gracilibacteria bacterium]NUJ99295.1 ATP-binding cassette domain-containing protein [Candidatus Gracilibacteria bacterium]